MKPIFLMIKTKVGKAYELAALLADLEIASEIYSISGEYDLMLKIYVEDDTDIGRKIAELVVDQPLIRDTYTLITHRAF
ncbi:MAG: Lrp/AsnC ligand binding domain-containing protein [Rhizobiaceae bacterium]|nr:Lrp/AsnC ligand binding domain-containing protein [Rhizobiaceae bacterium]MBL4695900.1 Lrp/AsnC ligand binding domain-containing protein [Rhizobiaceae bacterium]MBL4733027.1 Lrp/AsnC ligand binding domain-containing protein [Rhizobiaceae bacterium]